MVYDEDLADRVREVIQGVDGVTEKRMFGGLAFLLRGNMAVSASGRGGLLLRCDPEQTDSLVAAPGVDRFKMRGKEMDGWLHVDPEAIQTDQGLRRWVTVGVGYAGSLPPK
jgi:TfoX/Sxy family transcriptional regulator of competence genes